MKLALGTYSIKLTDILFKNSLYGETPNRVE